MEFNKTNEDSERGFAPREMVKGNWKCADCGKEITELPFEPSPDRQSIVEIVGQKGETKRFDR